MVLDGITFIKKIKCTEFTFLEDFVRPYAYDFRWNEFFQFVLFFSLAPMPAVAYGIFYNIYII